VGVGVGVGVVVGVGKIKKIFFKNTLKMRYNN